MAKRKVCSKCKLFVVGESCPNCKGNRFSTNWQGRLYVSDPENSVVAQKMGITAKGEYAIKVK
jgi:DNA-directed RNA polymerase subunit E"